MTKNNMDDYIKDITSIISKNHGKIAQLHKEIETLVQENTHHLKQLEEAIRDK